LHQDMKAHGLGMGMRSRAKRRAHLPIVKNWMRTLANLERSIPFHLEKAFGLVVRIIFESSSRAIGFQRAEAHNQCVCFNGRIKLEA